MSYLVTHEEIASKVALAEGILGHSFSDKSIIAHALIHPSAVEDAPVEQGYERLEFLGDSIVGAVIAYEIYRRFPHMDEGGMTRIKVSLVSGSTLAQVADGLGLAPCIVFGGSETGTGKRGLHSALENVYEAVVAALFLDAGLDVARAFVLDTLGSLVSEDFAKEPENPKSQLQELLQAHRVAPAYSIIDTAGPPHDRLFTAQVRCGEVALGEGTGKSKKDAEASAAAQALQNIANKGIGWIFKS